MTPDSSYTQPQSSYKHASTYERDPHDILHSRDLSYMQDYSHGSRDAIPTRYKVDDPYPSRKRNVEFIRDTHESRYRFVTGVSRHSTSGAQNTEYRRGPQQYTYDDDMPYVDTTRDVEDRRYRHETPGPSYTQRSQHSADQQGSSYRRDISGHADELSRQYSSTSHMHMPRLSVQLTPSSSLEVPRKSSDVRLASERTSYTWDTKDAGNENGNHQSGFQSDRSGYSHHETSRGYDDDLRGTEQDYHESSSLYHRDDILYSGVVTSTDSLYTPDKPDTQDASSASYEQFTRDSSSRQRSRKESGYVSDGDDDLYLQEAPLSQPQEERDSGYEQNTEEPIYKQDVTNPGYAFEDPENMDNFAYEDDFNYRKKHHKHDSMLRRALRRWQTNI